ncbi:hypothetical protein N7481_003364 [Penicillium waksmanii]|uniref:uncharacterized protein n=1 Tax=Penicillium waksmanii TaxID=69791 RepID=UPI00254703B2|nr:uncharacterized protein N7481_003364 [Penicillium waksmanii]KAJ5988154.1 hypothetical protein N7481_003364 [Penicillium waksmanii]
MADPVIDDSERLQDAITRLSAERLAQLCKNLCDTNPSARTFFRSRLFVEEDKVPGPQLPEPEYRRPFGHLAGPVPGSREAHRDEDENDEYEDEDNEDDEGDGDSVASEPAFKPGSLKRTRPRFAVCVNCEKEFDVAENTSESCTYHPGNSKPDEDFFADHDEDCHGIIDTDEMREEYPDGYIYECCKRNGEEEPCIKDWHEPTDPEAAKRRLIQYGGDSDPTGVDEDAIRLSNAIGRLSWPKLVQLTRILCQKNDAAREFYRGNLLVNEEDVPRPSTPRSPDRSPSPSETSDDGDEEKPPKSHPVPNLQKTGAKRSRPRYAVCINCEGEFDVVANTRKSCQYHWSEAEVDEDSFADHDEFTHGPMDTEDNRAAYPKNFIYDCCDRTSDDKGCTTDWHRETEELTKRQKKGP